MENKRNPANQYPHFAIEPRIKLLWSDPRYARIMKAYRVEMNELHKSRPSIRRDFWNGEFFDFLCDKRGLFGDIRDMAMVFSTDGFPLLQKKKFSVWPMILLNLNLPPEIRFKRENVFITSCSPGPVPTDHDLDSFIYPVKRKFEMLGLVGSRMWDASVMGGEYFRIKVHLSLVISDMMARFKLLGMMGHRALKFCEYCQMVGIWSSTTTTCPHRPPTNPSAKCVSNQQKKKEEKKVFFDLFPDNPAANEFYPYRKDIEFSTYTSYLKLHPNDTAYQQQHGIKKASIFEGIPAIAFPWSFPPDLMHLLFENVFPQMLQLHMGTTDKDETDKKPVAVTQSNNNIPQNNNPDEESDASMGEPTSDGTTTRHRKRAAHVVAEETDSEGDLAPHNSDRCLPQGAQPRKKRRIQEPYTRPTRSQRRSVSVRAGPSRGRPRQADTRRLSTKNKGNRVPSKKTSTTSKKKKTNRGSKQSFAGESFVVDKKEWLRIIRDVVASNRSFPAQFRDPLTDFGKTLGTKAKAANTKRWAFSLAPIMLKGVLEKVHYDGFMLLVVASMKASKFNITDDEIAEVGDLLVQFIRYFEEHVYKYDYYRLRLCTPSMHQVGRHIAKFLSTFGPLALLAQWVMERICFFLKYGVKSRKMANTNMFNNITRNEQTSVLYLLFSKSGLYDGFSVTGDSGENQSKPQHDNGLLLSLLDSLIKKQIDFDTQSLQLMMETASNEGTKRRPLNLHELSSAFFTSTMLRSTNSRDTSHSASASAIVREITFTDRDNRCAIKGVDGFAMC